MGLLDDAIREHLDLMRARGGDPAEVERMERDALGPVRREPTIGSARAEAVGERAPAARGPVVGENHLEDFEELQEQGYHDSTAPHPHPHHEHLEDHHEPADDRFGPDNGAGFTEQPRRRFLRRNRSSSQSAPHDRGFGLDEPGFDPLAPDMFGPHDPLDHGEPVEHEDPVTQHEPLAHIEPSTEPLAHDEPIEQPTAQEQVPPPHLRFEQPPKRPRFSSEPPGLHQADSEDRAQSSPAEADEVQETTEFDVQKHIAETRHQPDEAQPVASAPPAASTPPAGPTAPAPSTAPAAPAPTPRATPATSTPPAVPPPTPPDPLPPAALTAPAADLPEDEEDVLEETPEFLQDTPEHDRLWFEQRPPKDFDFEG